MTAELPDNLRSLDDDLINALSVFAPPKDLDAKILDHVSRRTRLRLVPSPLMVKTAAAVVAIGLLAGVGYVADRQMAGESPLAIASEEMRRFGIADKIPGWYAETKVTEAESRFDPEYFRRSEAASKPASERQRSQDTSRSDAVNSLIADTRKLAEQGNYSEALKTVDQILTIDPSNDYGTGVRQILRDRASLGKANVSSAETLEKVEGKEIRHSDLLTYPADWPDLSARREQTAREGGQATPSTATLRSSATHDQDGQNVLYADGHAEFQKSPYTGTQNDNIYNYRSRRGDSVNAPRDSDDGVLLPADGPVPVPKLGLDKKLEGARSAADFENAPDFSLTANRPAGGGGGGGGGPGLFGDLSADHFKPGQVSQAASTSGKTSVDGGRTIVAGGEVVAPIVNKLELKDGAVGQYDMGGNVQTASGAATGQAAGSTEQQPPAVVVRQKVIRNGVVEFEVDSFDTALMTITKLVVEQGGFVAATDSAKLPNGKTRGAVTLRIPPERLDTFVLMLRGVGDLKSQKISAQDVSKVYSDIESQLKAARAMETRLLEMIQKGQGAIKDLLAAEKELGVWREKIEKFEGEKRYYDNLISLSTLTVTLQERDIKASSATIETESVSAGVETDDVEKARSEIIKSIDEAKGRIISSDLKKLDAGQFAATIVAEVEPDRAGPVVDRLKQLGKVARLDVDRKQTTVDGTGRPVPGAHVEKKPTTLTISLYNLANVAPRLTTSATLASDNVEDNYRQIMAIVEKAGGRVVTSQLQRPKPDQVQATLQIEVPSTQAAATQAALQALGETMNLQLSENPDTANVTTAKQGFSLRIISAASVPARETTTLQLATKDVSEAHRTLQAAAEAGGARVVQSNVTEGDRDNVSAVLLLELPRAKLSDWDKAQQSAGEVLTRSVVRSSDTQNTLDSKVRLSIAIYPVDKLPPRQTTSASLHVTSAESSQQTFLTQASQLGGRVIDQSVSRDANGRSNARVVFDVPREQSTQIISDLRSAGEIWAMNTSTNPQAPDGSLSRTRFDLQFSEGKALVGPDDGVWSSIKAGLATSLQGLGWSVRLLVIGLCLVAPWALLIWGAWKLIRRKKAAPKDASLAV